MVANGAEIEYPLDSVSAAINFLVFNVLPYEGGTFNQPARLLREMKLVVSVYRAEENRRIEAGMK